MKKFSEVKVGVLDGNIISGAEAHAEVSPKWVKEKGETLIAIYLAKKLEELYEKSR